jgi:hypothetical protein
MFYWSVFALVTLAFTIEVVVFARQMHLIKRRSSRKLRRNINNYSGN